MREIKFRAQDKHTKEWVYSDKEGMVSFWMGVKTGDLINVSEYTGLKDKNSREIYEGDIVKHKDMLQQVIYFGAAFRLCPPSIYNSVFLQYERDLEVIGNIYENPELLKV